RAAWVREQHERARRELAQKRSVDWHALGGRAWVGGRTVECAHPARKMKQARDLVVDRGLGHRSLAHGRDQLLAPRSVGPGHHEVEARARAWGGRGGGRPVRDDDALEAPFLLEQPTQEE